MNKRFADIQIRYQTIETQKIGLFPLILKRISVFDIGTVSWNLIQLATIPKKNS